MIIRGLVFMVALVSISAFVAWFNGGVESVPCRLIIALKKYVLGEAAGAGCGAAVNGLQRVRTTTGTLFFIWLATFV